MVVVKFKVELRPFLQDSFDLSTRKRFGERCTHFDFQRRGIVKLNMEYSLTLLDTLDSAARNNRRKLSIQHRFISLITTHGQFFARLYPAASACAAVVNVTR